MAGNAVIGALRVVLGADTAALETGLKSAQSSLASFGANAGRALAAAGAALSAAALGLGVSIKSTIDKADELSKMAQKYGVPIEQLSALKYVADLAGVSLESLAKGLGKLARATVDAAQGSTTAVEAFKALKIDFRDSNGAIKSVSDLLPQIANRFASMKDGTVKTALAMQIFGKAGADLIPLLNGGAKGIKELTDEAIAFGIVIDGKTGLAAEAFNDNLTRLHAVFKGIVTQVTAQMLPAFLQFSQVMVDAAKNTDLMKGVADGLVNAIRSAIDIALTAGLIFQRLGAEISAFWKVLMAPNWAEMKAAWGEFNKVGEETDAKFRALGDYLKKFWDDSAAGAPVAAKSVAAAFNPAIIDKTKSALQSFLDTKIKGIAAFQAEAGAVRLSTAEQERAKIVAEALAIAKANHITVTEALRSKIEQTAAAFAKWNMVANYGKQVFEQTRTPVEQFGATMERLNMAYQSGAMDADTYARGVAQAQEKLVQANTHAQNLGSSLESAFDKAITAGAKLGDVVKSLIQDFIKMEARSAFKSLLYGTAGAGGGFSGILGSLFGGFRAAGGPVSAGRSYVVGENGPEIYKPSGAGQIIPNKDIMGASGNGSMTVHVSLDNEMLRAVVTDQSGKVISQAAPSIIGSAVSLAGKAVPSIMQDAQQRIY